MLKTEEVECGCCYELLLEPTTLTCGHSFCRYCLAKWFKLSKKAECPECRAKWTGFPKVNVHLRSIVEKSFPDEIKARMISHKSTPDYHEIVTEFEEYGKKEGGVQSASLSEEQIKGLIFLGIVVIAVVLIILLIGIFYWVFFTESRPSEVIYSRTPQSWSIKDVEAWAQAFNHQLGYDYSERFAKAGIHGEILLSLDEKDLESAPLNITTALHRKIILAEITKLKMSGVHQPHDLWEYKNAFRVSSIYMLFMLQDFPRLTILYNQFLHYDTVYLPFMKIVMDKTQHCEIDEIHTGKCAQVQMTSMDKIWFYISAVFLPYYLFARFSSYFGDVHFYTTWIIISHCVMLSVREAMKLSRVQIRLTTLWNTMIDASISFFITTIIYRIVVLFLPSFILDFCFIAKLYYGPIDTANSIRRGHLHTNAIGKVLDVVFGAINRVVAVIVFLVNSIRGRQAEVPVNM